MRSKMRGFHLQLFVVLVFCLSQFQGVWCENHDVDEVSTPAEKGKFYQTHVFGERPKGCSVVYSADASAMSSTWNSSDFRLLNDVYTTGAYFENKIYSAESPTIHIPTVTYSDRLFVCLEEMFEVESSYDYVWIDVTTDGGNIWSRIYGKSGYTEGMVIDYLDVSFLSGKDAIFKISLKSDSSFTGAGWDIKKFDVLSYVRYAKKEERKSQLRSGDIEPVKRPYPGQNGGETGSEGGQSGSEEGESGTEGNPEITINKLKILNVQWESKDEGVISFSALDDNDNFVENIDLKDINVVIKKNGTPFEKEISGSEGCLSFDKTQSQRMVDIVLVVDYSTSMAGAIRNLRNSIFNMLQTLDHFDPRFSLIQYGIGNGLQKFYPNRELLGNEMYWVLDENNNYFYDLETLKKLFKLCTQCGCYEYAYDALMNAFNLQKYRPGASKVVILLYDQDGESPSYNISHQNVLEKLNDVQLFTITDETDYTNNDIQKLATSSGGDYANFQSSTNEELKIMIDGENVILGENGSINFRFVENNNGKNDTIWVSRDADAININEASFILRSLYDHYDKYDACRILNAYANNIEPGSYAFSQFAKKISDNLLNRHYLRISSKCFSETSLECGENYSISIEINGKSDLANTKYVYPGAVIRAPETSKYDIECLDSDLPVKFSIAGGCDNAVYGDAKVVYMYPDDPKKTTHTLDKDKIIKLNNNYYSTTIPLEGQSGEKYRSIKYRIEVSQVDGNDAVFPTQYGFLDGFWNVYACNSGDMHPKIVNPNAECVSTGDTKQLNFSVGIENAVENGEVYLFFNSADTVSSYAFDYKILKANEDGTYSTGNIILRDGKEYFDYYVLYVDPISKSILANYGNGHDDINRVEVSNLRCKDVCHNISLSSHVLVEDDDVLSFDIYDDDEKVEILLCDTMGNKIIRQPIAVSSGDKEKSVSLISELDLRSSKYHLKYTMPYILVLKIGEKVHYMYVYLGRKKEQN